MGTVSNIASSIAAATNNTTSTAATTGTNAGTSLASDFTTFLGLLTTQLQDQDPTSPVDSNQFTQQLVEFAGVQQQVASNTTLSSILSTLQSNQISSASSYIGKEIQATSSQISLASSSSTFGYTLPAAASSATVTITDSSGAVVFSGSGPVAAGSNTVQWNGTNSNTGATEPDGTYNVAVSAKDANGNPLTASTYISGTVSSAQVSNGSVVLDVGSLQVPVANITNISNITTTTSS